MRGGGKCACEAPWVRDASRRRTVFFFETTWIVKRCSDSLPPDATDASDSESRWPSGEPSASLDTRKKSPHAEVPTFATGLNSASVTSRRPSAWRWTYARFACSSRWRRCWSMIASSEPSTSSNSVFEMYSSFILVVDVTVAARAASLRRARSPK